MQTFLPDNSFAETARILDNRRLGKQRVEAYQIIEILLGKQSGWEHHPAVKMWSGNDRYIPCLMIYYNAMLKEWANRGFKNIKLQPFTNDELCAFDGATRPPWCCGDGRVHSSHRAALLAKDYEWYSQFNWTEKPVIDYYWPINKIQLKLDIPC